MSNTTTKKAPTELGTEKVGKLLMQYAIPAIIAQIAASLYNLTDRAFIGHMPDVGKEAISGLTNTFPFMNLSVAFGAMVGVGGATLLSVRLGQRDYTSAKNILGNLVTLNVIVGFLFAVVSFLFIDEILLFFGASENTLPYASDYMEVVLAGNIITHLYFGINASLRSSGHPKQAMVATIMTVVMNAVLTPLFIFGFGMGIRGAALATILAQAITLMWQTKQLSNPNELLHLQRGIYKPKGDIVKRILRIGMSPFLINTAACMVVIIINQGLRENSVSTDDGDLSTAAYGISNSMQFIFVMIVLGLTQGMQPIVSYNYGAKQPARVRSALMLTMKWATLVTTVGGVVCVAFPGVVVRIFTSDPLLIERASWAMRVMCMFMPVIGFQLVTTNFFQSIGKVNRSIFLSLTRQVLMLIPLLLILPNYYGVEGVWYSMPISDVVAAMLTVVTLMLQFKEWKREQINNL
ncbi:MAG: MATE family efflux transporter [Bacteroidaceae bacterium]|nr:MATE family efflux transporter [Bacteroidaceae bacterium]